METHQTINNTNIWTADSPAKKTFSVLSWYPFIWTIGILLGGLLKSHSLIMFIMGTWVIFVYVGVLIWLGLLIYLPLKKKITFKQIIFNILILSLGTIAAYYVFIYDIFDSGVKYID